MLSKYWLLRVNLSNRVITKQEIPREWIEMYLGGKTLGLFLALKEGLANVEPLSAENKIFFLTGPITGFTAGSGGTSLITKSPLSTTMVDSIAQGSLGYSLKASGFDGLIIEGVSADPVYLFITEYEQKILPASRLWGARCSQVYSSLRSLHPNITNSTVVSIGPAGENLVRFACIMADTRAFGRGGAGSVMGSKRLKGILVGGKKALAPYDNTILEYQHQFLRQYAHSGDHPYRAYQLFGTASVYNSNLKIGCMSGSNYRAFNYDDPAMVYLVQELIRTMKKNPSSCFRCYLMCSRTGIIQEGEFAQQRSNGPEFETIWAFGPQSGNRKLNIIVDADYLCDEMGLDTISTGHIIGFYLECLEQGLIKNRYHLGNELDIIDTIKQISYRQGLGDLLAEGVWRLAKRLGPQAESYAMHVKGMELPAYDPRGFIGIALAYAVNKRGGDHRKSFCPKEAKGSIDGSILESKAQMVILEEQMSAYRDSLVVCKWGAFGETNPYYPDAIYGAIGLRIDYQSLLHVGQRAINMAQILNHKQGNTSAQDTLPERFFKEPKQSGPLMGKVVNRQGFEQLLNEYYLLQGWTKQGIPKPETLRRLGLTDTAILEYCAT